jgi:hypothetical protein
MGHPKFRAGCPFDIQNLVEGIPQKFGKGVNFMACILVSALVYSHFQLTICIYPEVQHSIRCINYIFYTIRISLHVC